MSRAKDAAVARRLHGTSGRLFVHMGDGIWKDTDNGNTGSRDVLVDAWLGELSARDAEAKASKDVAAYWQATAGGQPKATN